MGWLKGSEDKGSFPSGAFSIGGGRDTTLTQITPIPGSKYQVNKRHRVPGGKKDKRGGCSHGEGPDRPGGGSHIPGWHLLYRRASWQGNHVR